MQKSAKENRMMHSLPRRLASAIATAIVLLVLAVPAVASAHPGPSLTPPTARNTTTSSSTGASCTQYPNGTSVCSSPASPSVSTNTTTSATFGVTCIYYPDGIGVCSSPGQPISPISTR